MPCVFNTKPENRNCRFCTVTICDERQPKPVETFATNKIEQYDKQSTERRKGMNMIYIAIILHAIILGCFIMSASYNIRK